MARRQVVGAFLGVLGAMLILLAGPGGAGPGSVLAVSDATPSGTPPSSTPTTPTLTPTRTATPTATSTVGPANQISLSLSGDPRICGSTVTVFATVTKNGVPVTNGTAVLFTTSTGGSATGFTVGGVASVNIVVPINFSGSIIVQANSGNAVSQTVINAFCAVVPAQLSVSLLSTSIACGSSTQVIATVTDTLGRLVTDGTFVVFSAPGLNITQTSITIGGTASAVVQAPLGTSGTVIIQVSAAGIVRQVPLVITCAVPTAVPATPVPQPTSQVQGVQAAPRLPSAGSGPGPGANSGLLYAGIVVSVFASILFGSSVIPRRRKSARSK